ncbi:RNA demethylase ALKBH10B-like [Magnolia sinica]|uniref:RNA demethylase ALKBH10B-like n=1 Tax=Magnolia sinica TaxID=86752 RepID=UPI00265B6816|nr:RNA demethylase ALKBH10B-like [Magnolia sinica]
MPSAEGPTSPPPAAAPPQSSPLPMTPDTFARDAIISWFRGEFAAANAIIDALCHHLAQIDGGDRRSDYEAVFAAIHRRRLNWIPVLHMQKYFSITDVAIELRRAAAKKRDEEKKGKENGEEIGNGVCLESEDSSDQKTPEEEGSQVGQVSLVDDSFCSNHEDCEQRPASIKITKGFVAKEPVKGHMVNVVKSLKMYEDIFTDLELSKLSDFISELRLAGRRGDLSGETFMFFNKQLKGNKREIIQLGVPIFGPIKEEATSHIEPMPSILQSVIDHLVQWHLIPESRKPNSCIISFFDEGEYSQPYLKPPHLDHPISTLLLSESTMAFGRILSGDHDGNYKGPLMLTLKAGSLLVMRGNSADMARHVMCLSSNKRVSITFSKVQPSTNQISPSVIPPLTSAMTLWQPGGTQPFRALGYEAIDMVQKWGVLRTPLVMLAPPRPMVMGPKRIPRGGTGVFLPWTVGSKKSMKHLPPRVQRGRLPSLPSLTETDTAKPSPDPVVTM